MTYMESSLEAENAFYHAFESGDLEAMMSIWADSADAKCIHPLGTVLSGLSEIRASWAEILRAQPPRSFEIERVSVLQTPDLAIHTVFETLILPLQRQRFPPLLATNIYRKINGSWQMLMHHASPVGMVDSAPFQAAGPAATRH